jgi:chromosome segregation ATPase
MSDEITNKVLLKHMQAMKNDLQQQITGLDNKITGLDNKITGLDNKIDNVERRLKKHIDDGLLEAKEHRQALQEDLEATIAMQSKHQRKPEKISV